VSAAQEQPAIYEEYAATEPDRIATVLKYAVAFFIVTILCVLMYALIVGVFAPPAPRTLIESSLLEAQAAVKANPGSGQAWGALAGAQWAAGDESEAWATLEQGRKRVKDGSMVVINVMTLRFLSAEGKDAEILKRADGYIKAAAVTRVNEAAKNAGKGIKTFADSGDNSREIELFTLKATSQGNLGKWKDAVKTLDIAVELDPLGADLLTMRGWAKLRAGDKKGAKKDFKQALAYMPDNASAKQGMAEASGNATSTGK
jgi:tetratricopeptide (TPR) repeat protein